MSYGSLMFNADKALFLLIDYQTGRAKMMPDRDWSQVKHKVVALTKAAQILQVPLIVTSCQEEGVQGPVMSELAVLAPEAYAKRIQRGGSVNAWDDARLHDAVRASRRSQLVMAAIAVDTSLVFSAIAAARRGYQVQAVLDACGAQSALAEKLARRRMEREGVVLTTANILITEILQDWRRPGAAEVETLLFDSAMIG